MSLLSTQLKLRTAERRTVQDLPETREERFEAAVLVVRPGPFLEVPDMKRKMIRVAADASVDIVRLEVRTANAVLRGIPMLAGDDG
jgi:hypothetical protein